MEQRAANLTATLLALMLVSAAPRAADLLIPVSPLSQAPTLDGDLNDWRALGAHAPQALSTHPSFTGAPVEQSHIDDWRPDGQIQAGVFGDRLYLAVSWSDEKPDTIYRPWKRAGKRYVRDRKRDDMFALRFQTSEDFDICMLSGKAYEVDLWRWSAGRSALAGIADDMRHVYSGSYLPDATEYNYGGITSFIDKKMDAGDNGYRYTRRPKEMGKKRLPGVEAIGTVSGSVADVKAQARWHEGRWYIELSRALKTADPTDVVFRKGAKQTAQLAFFNSGYRLRKMVSDKLILDFSALE